MVSLTGFEPVAPGLGNLCSILLSYRDTAPFLAQNCPFGHSLVSVIGGLIAREKWAELILASVKVTPLKSLSQKSPATSTARVKLAFEKLLLRATAPTQSLGEVAGVGSGVDLGEKSQLEKLQLLATVPLKLALLRMLFEKSALLQSVRVKLAEVSFA